MSIDSVKDLISQLQTEIDATQLDKETVEYLKALEHLIHQKVGAIESDDGQESLLETAKKLEVQFATHHPRAEAIMREILDTLGRMGI